MRALQWSSLKHGKLLFWRKLMQIKKIAAAIALTLGSTAAFAENYRAEVGVGYSDIEDVDAITVFGEFHFKEVSTSGHPLEEAGFLEHSSNINASYTDFDNGELTTIGLELYLNNFYVAPGYADFSEGDGEGFVALGYAADGWRVTTTVPEEDYEANVDFKWVTGLSGETFINLEAGYADGGDDLDDILTAGLDYYFDRTFSVGAGIIDQEETDFQVRANKFFTGTVRAGLSFTNSDEADIITVDASIRF